MDKEISLLDYKIKVEFNEGIVRVFSNAELWHFFKGNTKAHCRLLVDAIQAEYLLLFNKPLQIGRASLALEILVHVYCDYLGLAFNRIIRVAFIQRLVDKLIDRAEVIDCGEKTKDTNRWVWDLLAPLSPLLLLIFPANLNKRHLKTY